MLTEDGKHLYVSYDEYHNLIEKLALKIHHSGWEFDNILCLARGGMRPGRTERGQIPRHRRFGTNSPRPARVRIQDVI